MPTLIGHSLPPTGSRIGFTGLTAPTGWVFGAGKTIGNAASGGTERANADTFALYELLWNSYTNSELQIQTSGGIGTTRGGSASADFAANKRMPTPDYRGRVGFGKDNLGGSTAGRVTAAISGITGTTLGAAGGSEAVSQHQHGPGSLVTDTENANHRHSYPASADDTGEGGNGIGSNLYGDTVAASGNGYMMNSNISDGFPGFVGSSLESAAHAHVLLSGQTAATGSNIGGTVHGNIAPAIGESVIIKL